MAGVYMYNGKIKKLLVAAWRSWAKLDTPDATLELRDTPDADQKLGSTQRGDQPAVNRLAVEHMVDSPPANEAPGTPYDEEIGVDTSGRV